MYQTKAATQSLGITAQVLAILVAMLKLNGVDISNDVVGIPEQVAHITDMVALLGLQLAALWGRIRATKPITGLFKPKA